MKIITSFESVWDEGTQSYVTYSEESHEYNGPVSQCGGGGSGGGGGTSTTIQSIPDELKPLASAYTSKAINLANTGYTPYSGQRYADLSRQQYAGINKITNRALSGSPTMDSAEENLNQMMSGGQNPYLDAMVQRAQDSVKSNMNTAAFNSGSYGNSGLQQEYGRALGDVATQMYGGAYDSDQARRMQAIGMAPTFGNQAYSDAAQLMNAGQVLQDHQQNNLDVGYQNYLDAQNLPYKQLAAMSGVFGSNLGSTSTTTQQNSGGGK